MEGTAFHLGLVGEHRTGGLAVLCGDGELGTAHHIAQRDGDLLESGALLLQVIPQGVGDDACLRPHDVVGAHPDEVGSDGHAFEHDGLRGDGVAPEGAVDGLEHLEDRHLPDPVGGVLCARGVELPRSGARHLAEGRDAARGESRVDEPHRRGLPARAGDEDAQGNALEAGDIAAGPDAPDDCDRGEGSGCETSRNGLLGEQIA